MSSPDRTPARLVLQQPDGEELVYALDPGQSVTLGRDAGNTIVLPSRFVSKKHALVSWTPRGVRIEDQDSENGVVVNGLNVQAAQLSSGDVIQIGDLRLVFADDGQAGASAPTAGGVAPGVGSKRQRLAVTATLVMLALVGGLAVIYVKVLAPALEQARRPSTAAREDPSLPPDTMVTPFDTPQAQAVEREAVAAAAAPVDKLFEQGELAYRNGRLLDAYSLLNGALLRDPQHEASRRLLRQVIGERELRLHDLTAAAARADEQLRFNDAAQQWGAVQALTLDNEPLHARARTESARLRQRAAQ